MTWGYVAIAGATLVSGYMSSEAQKDAANKAASAQGGSAQAGIDEQRRQFDAIQKLLQPYVTAGQGAIGAQQNLIGLGGAQAQQKAIQDIQNSPEYAALSKSGQEAILANAAATGNLRGGNVQSALAQFQPQLLSGLINQQYSRLGGLTSIGQNAAAGVGNAGMQTGSNIANLYGQQGAAQAGSALASGKANAGMWGSVGELAGMFQGSGFGGNPLQGNYLKPAGPNVQTGGLGSISGLGNSGAGDLLPSLGGFAGNIFGP